MNCVNFKQRSFSQIMEKTYEGYEYMAKRHPKAAKKRRIQKKWRKRFPVSLKKFFMDQIGKPRWMDNLPKNDHWAGGLVRIPFNVTGL